MARGEATVSVDDHGFTLGDGLFETIRVTQDRPNALRRHLARLASSMADLGFPVVPDGAWDRDIDAVLAANPAGSPSDEAALRLQVTSGRDGRGLTRIVSLRPLGDRERLRRHGLDLMRIVGGRAPTGGLGGHKSTGWLPSVAARRMHPAGMTPTFEGVFVGPDDEVLEGTTSTLFALFDERLITPPHDGRILAGVTRQRLLEEAPSAGFAVVEGALQAEDLFKAHAVLATNALLPITPCLALDGRALPQAPEVLRALRACLEGG